MRLTLVSYSIFLLFSQKNYSNPWKILNSCIANKGIRKSYRFAKNSTIGNQIKQRIKEEMMEEYRHTQQNMGLNPSPTPTKGGTKTDAKEERLSRFRSTVK